MFGKVTQPYWDDKPVVVVGGGPSLQDFDFEQIRGVHVLAIKSAMLAVPWADAVFGVGMAHFEEWRDKLLGLRGPRIYWAMEEDAPAPAKNVTFLKRRDGRDVADNPAEIFSDGNCGFAALQICLHKRANQIVLFGYDYDGSFANNVISDKRRADNVQHWGGLAEHFSVFVPHLARRGINVVNACPSSTIRCFQKVALQDGVAMLREKLAA